MSTKKKIIGGVEYIILGSTIESIGFKIIKKSYTTTKGIVIVENCKVKHPDGSVTYE